MCCELCSRLRPTGSRSTTAKRSRWKIQRRLLWRSGQNLSALQAAINFGHRKSANNGSAIVRKGKYDAPATTILRSSKFIELLFIMLNAVFMQLSKGAVKNSSSLKIVQMLIYCSKFYHCKYTNDDSVIVRKLKYNYPKQEPLFI